MLAVILGAWWTTTNGMVGNLYLSHSISHWRKSIQKNYQMHQLGCKGYYLRYNHKCFENKYILHKRLHLQMPSAEPTQWRDTNGWFWNHYTGINSTHDSGADVHGVWWTKEGCDTAVTNPARCFNDGYIL